MQLTIFCSSAIDYNLFLEISVEYVSNISLSPYLLLHVSENSLFKINTHAKERQVKPKYAIKKKSNLFNHSEKSYKYQNLNKIGFLQFSD